MLHYPFFDRFTLYLSHSEDSILQLLSLFNSIEIVEELQFFHQMPLNSLNSLRLGSEHTTQGLVDFFLSKTIDPVSQKSRLEKFGLLSNSLNIDLSLLSQELKSYQRIFRFVDLHNISLSDIFTSYPYLEELSITGSGLNFAPFDINNPVNQQRLCLKKLRLEHVSKLTLLGDILNRSPNLEELDLQNFVDVGSGDLKINQKMFRLKRINLSSNQRIGLGWGPVAVSYSLSALLENTPNLEELTVHNFMGCPRFPHSFKLPFVKKIDFSFDREFIREFILRANNPQFNFTPLIEAIDHEKQDELLKRNNIICYRKLSHIVLAFTLFMTLIFLRYALLSTYWMYKRLGIMEAILSAPIIYGVFFVSIVPLAILSEKLHIPMYLRQENEYRLNMLDKLSRERF